MLKYGLWLNWSLAIYLWLVDLISLGRWNYQTEPHLISVLINGGRLTIADISFLICVLLPAIAFTIGYYLANKWIIGVALIADLIWLTLQILSWWVPYIFGTKKQWQINYAHLPTTKILPSFGNHIAPDGLHTVISILLIAAIFFTIGYLRQVKKGTVI